MQLKLYLRISIFRICQKGFTQLSYSFYMIYRIINKPFMLNFQYFVYLCIETITLIKRFGYLLNKSH